VCACVWVRDPKFGDRITEQCPTHAAETANGLRAERERSNTQAQRDADHELDALIRRRR
jgi:hypothetical protein